jgi:AcrR family transcriptional regulator
MIPPPKPTKKEVITAFRTQEILRAARQVMEQRGLEAVTMEDIATAAGVAKGTIYLYFQSKDDLIQALMSKVGENLLLDLDAILEAPGSPPEKLRRVVAMLLNYLEREWILFPVFARDWMRGEREEGKGRWQHIQELEEKLTNRLTRLFAAGIASGQFIQANPRLLAFLVRGLVRAVGYYQMMEKREDVVKETLPVLFTFLSAGIIRQAGSPTKVAIP